MGISGHFPLQPEALFRNFLYGNRYFEDKFGVTSKDVFLPDCFGFGYALPSIAKHSNLLGVSSQKLSWGGAYECPFDLGVWQGVDGSRIFASLKPLSYRYSFDGDVRGDLQIIDKLADNGVHYGLPWTMNYYGTGDWGGAPNEQSVASVEQSVAYNDTSETQVISASSDEVFKQLDALSENEKTSLPVWAPELFYDDVKRQYMIIWASCIPGKFPDGLEDHNNNHRLYYTTTKDFKTFSKAKLLIEPGFSSIDATIRTRFTSWRWRASYPTAHWRSISAG